VNAAGSTWKGNTLNSRKGAACRADMKPGGKPLICLDHCTRVSSLVAFAGYSRKMGVGARARAPLYSSSPSAERGVADDSIAAALTMDDDVRRCSPAPYALFSCSTGPKHDALAAGAAGRCCRRCRAASAPAHPHPLPPRLCAARCAL